MPRSLVLGNGNLLINFDAYLQMRDVYFPYVGMEDQTGFGDAHRLGVWVAGKGFSWVSQPGWQITIQYQTETLVGNATLENASLGLFMTVQDFVHPVHNILIRHFSVRALDEQSKEVRLFFHHDFHIYGDKQKDTAFYEPYTNSVIHYRQNRYFLIGGDTSCPVACQTGHAGGPYASILHSKQNVRSCGLTQYSIGKSEYRGLEGTWRDAEDGQLMMTTVDQGSVDSTVAIHCLTQSQAMTEVTLWVCFGQSLDEVADLQEFVIEETPARMQRHCQNYWRSWVNKSRLDAGSLSTAALDLYKRSLLSIRLHADNHGGILAAADADIMAFNRDTYTYVWPRDGAFVCLALDKASYSDITRRFFEFCCQTQTRDGYLLHKYNPDGSVGSTWHPWFRGGEAQLPIQEDETALVLYALLKHFERAQDFEFLNQMYERFLKNAASFLCNFRERESGLPLPSYDPWEEDRGVFTYTTACTAAGLSAAAQISQFLGHYTHFERYQAAADEVKQAMLFHLFDDSTRCFVKKIVRQGGQTIARDLTPDMSIAVIWKLGVLPPDDARVVSTMQRLTEALTVRTAVGGIARYTNDVYHAKVPSSAEIPGNPWILTTLWLAQWHIALARTTGQLQPARAIIDWAVQKASATGLLPEQLHPVTGEHLSVAPLTWSHATYIETVLQYLEKERACATAAADVSVVK